MIEKRERLTRYAGPLVASAALLLAACGLEAEATSNICTPVVSQAVVDNGETSTLGGINVVNRDGVISTDPELQRSELFTKRIVPGFSVVVSINYVNCP